VAVTPGTARGSADVVASATALEVDGRFLEAARLIERLPRTDRDPLLDVHAVSLRHRAFAEFDGAPSAEVPSTPPDLFGDTRSAPEVSATALAGDVLDSALHHHGCLIVRGLVPSERCPGLRADIDRAFDAFDDRGLFRPLEQTAPWFARVEHDERFDEPDPLATAFLRSAGGVYAPTAPRAFIEYRNLLEDVGLIGVVGDHLRDMPVLSVNKSVLRRIGGGAEPSWHQDGYYLEVEGRAVNLWVALSRCGGDSDVMGLDILAGPQHGLAPQGTHNAADPRAVAQEVVEDLAVSTGRPIERPLFEPGDGILFGQYFLHRSDIRPLPTERYAIETWFLSAHGYPDHLVPLVAG
jgi:hypothetical protein